MLVFAYSCGFNLLLLAPSIYLLQIYDRVLSSRSVDTLVMLTLIVAVAVTVGAILDMIRRAALSRIAAWLDDCLRPVVLAASLDYARRVNPIRANEAYRDLATLRQFIESPLLAVLFDLLWAPLFIVVLFLVHPLVGGIGLLCALLLFGFALAGEVATREPLARAAAAQARSYGRFWSAIGSIRVIDAMGMMDGVARLVSRDADEARRALDATTSRTERIQVFAKPTRALAQVLIMGAAAWLVLRDQRSPGIIFVSSLLFGRGLAPVEAVVGGWKVFGSVRDSYRRLTEVLAAAPYAKRTTPLPAAEGRLTLDNVSFCPPGKTSFVLRGVSFRISPGECLGIIGPSGAGKSTLGRLIAGVLTPTIGRVYLDSIDVATWHLASDARHLGYLPQEIELFGRSVGEVIAGLKDAEPGEIIRAAKLAGVHEAIMQLPEGYDTEMEAAAASLLLSQRQRLGLARACFGNPRLVVLDEPNANQDHFGELALMEAIERLKASRATVVVITHRMGILPVTDKIALLQGGALSAFGRSQEIFERYLMRPRIDARQVPEKGPSAEARPDTYSRMPGEQVS